MVLRADDDGVVEAYPIMKLLGSTPDTLKILLAKRFIIQLNEDQVVLIQEWSEHNNIRADRKIDSVYKDLIPVEIKLLKPKARSDVKDNSKRLSNGQSTDSIGKVRLGKDRLSKYKEEVFEFWNKKKIIVHKNLSKEAEKEIEKILGYPYKTVKDTDGAVKDILKSIDVYSIVLNGSGYWWSHKWNLFEFLKRGNKQFEGKSPKDYLKGREINNKVDKFN